MTYYVLERNGEEYTIVLSTPGSNPLYGFGSWNLFAGPFESREEAEMYLEEIPVNS